ncbi:hypothetical protein F8205_gp133 [Paramecium bursaria Chlorella virus CVA-1]|uniref:Uncharacterized protein n=1 Tax=Paramecium bursaria Chlorella virus CVA-1 TaxID=42683 RepID=M1HFU5_9PHYC|nr:hypothetical protein F8205_gp133 [Paramecium bursaria Chlorella virus CVA-1]AGE50692.1 hypothetical protein PBCVCVA1_1009R [Paramecium bursaria Chlorella virus CVA-1]
MRGLRLCLFKRLYELLLKRLVRLWSVARRGKCCNGSTKWCVYRRFVYKRDTWNKKYKYQDHMTLKWFSRPHRKEEEFAEKLDLIEKQYADRLDRKEKEIIERLGHVDNELAKTLGVVETEYLRLRKFQDKLNTCMELLQSDNAVLRATINDLQSKEKSLPKNLTS